MCFHFWCGWVFGFFLRIRNVHYKPALTISTRETSSRSGEVWPLCFTYSCKMHSSIITEFVLRSVIFLSVAAIYLCFWNEERLDIWHAMYPAKNRLQGKAVFWFNLPPYWFNLQERWKHWSNKTEISIIWAIKDKMGLTRHFSGWLLGWFLAWLHTRLRGRISTWLSAQLPSGLFTFLHSVVPSLLCAILLMRVSAVVRGQLCAWLRAGISALLHTCCLKQWGNRGT